MSILIKPVSGEDFYVVYQAGEILAHGSFEALRFYQRTSPATLSAEAFAKADLYGSSDRMALGFAVEKIALAQPEHLQRAGTIAYVAREHLQAMCEAQDQSGNRWTKTGLLWTSPAHRRHKLFAEVLDEFGPLFPTTPSIKENQA